MSVDIVGSTQFKQLLSQRGKTKQKESTPDPSGVDSHSGPWLFPILEFYSQISNIFAEAWSQYSQASAVDPGWQAGERPKIWKAVGDELIFIKDLDSHQQAYIAVAAWAEAVKRYRKVIRQHSQNLDLKCAAWIAGFPINNAAIVLEQVSGDNADLVGDDGDYIFSNLRRLKELGERGKEALCDYIGPSMDTGFRVASLASPRKFVITIDLALILSHVSCALSGISNTLPPFEFFYQGRERLKGVTNEAPYPIFWIDASDDDELIRIEDGIIGQKATAPSEVRKFCEHFLDKNKETHVMHPYICTDTEKKFQKIPAWHEDKLRTLGEYWENESKRLSSLLLAAQEGEVDGGAAPVEAKTLLDDVSSLGKALNKHG